MPDISINVAGKIATALGAPVIICGNSDYLARFTFDDEWSDYDVKTARFVYQAHGEMHSQDVVFEGDTAAVPVMAGVQEVLVGVYAGDLHTTTPARVPCERSILCWEPVHDEPTPDVYNQLLELLSSGGKSVGSAAYATDQAVAGTVAIATTDEEV